MNLFDSIMLQLIKKDLIINRREKNIEEWYYKSVEMSDEFIPGFQFKQCFS